MLNRLNINSGKQKLIVYIILTLATLAVFWQVNRYDFVKYDDHIYVTENIIIQSGITQERVSWALSANSKRYADLWHPLIWLSLMFDYQLYGLNPGGYHLTNLILHILSTLLLFWLFNRMTGDVWKSAFVAALFAFHPLHVESVAWIAERKDVLSAFFWMLTLCLYVYYTEKPLIRRYLLVVFSFVCALMSKPMVVTLPLIMIFLDYWPLNRFESKKGNLFLWQLREKTFFFILSAVLVIITFYSPNDTDTSAKVFSLISRLANVPVAFITYLIKTFWPHDMAIFYPFTEHLPIWQVLGSSLLIIAISAIVIVMAKRFPYLFVGWLWFSITIAPVIGIIQISLSTPYAIADRYHYLPSIGIATMLAWGIPSFIKSEKTKKILFSTAIIFIIILAFLTWKQCGYWKNSATLFSHALQVTKNNYLAHASLGLALFGEGKINEALYHYNEAIRISPYYADAYNNRGIIYDNKGQYKLAIEDYNTAIANKHYYAQAYNNRANIYYKLGQYQLAIEDYNKAIAQKPDFAEAYCNRGIFYGIIGQYQLAIADFNKAIRLNENYAEAYNNKGFTNYKIGQYQLAIEDYNKAITHKSDYADAYCNRAVVYLEQGYNKIGCSDAQKACDLGNCKTLESAKGIGYCR